jgi:hypothetical protein
MKTWLLALLVSVIACQTSDNSENPNMCRDQFDIQFVDPVTNRQLGGKVYGSKFIFDQPLEIVASVLPLDHYDDKLKEIGFWPNSQQCGILRERTKLASKTRESSEWEAVKKLANEPVGEFGWGRLVAEPYPWPNPTVAAIKNKISQERQCNVDVQYLEIKNTGQHNLKANNEELLSPLVFDAFSLSSLKNQIFDYKFELTAAEYCDLISGNIWGEVEVLYNGQTLQGQRVNFAEEYYFY